jgi:hypothetical protein
VSAAEEFAQYQLPFIDYLQHDYEVIRPIVLFAETITERSRQTGLERTTIGDKARRFVQEGMLGLVDRRAGHAGRKGHRYPEPVAAYMLYVKQLYTPLHDRELVRIGSIRGFLRSTGDLSIMSGGMPLHPAQRGVTRGLC